MSTSVIVKKKKNGKTKKKMFWYLLGMANNLIQDNLNPKAEFWWNEIIDGIIISALPLDKHLDILLNEVNVINVLSVVERFEIKTKTFYFTPIQEKGQPGGWPDYINQMVIETPDHGGIEISLIKHGIDFLKDCVKKERLRVQQENKDNKKRKHLVHCKSGHGRSASIVVGYIMSEHNMNLQSAYDFAISKRSSVHLTEAHQEPLRGYEKQYLSKKPE